MRITFTVHSWHVLAYVGIGVLSVPPLMYLGWKRLAKFHGRPTFIERQRELMRSYGWKYLPWMGLLVVAWPLGWWEELR